MPQETITTGSPRWHELRARARNDLWWVATKLLQLEDKVPLVEHAHYALCRFIERRTGIPEVDACRIQLIQVGRGWGKSALITNARATQRLLQDRNYALGIANERQDNANAFLGAVKGNFESNELLQFLFPELLPDFKKTLWRSDRIIINRTVQNPVNPSILATGVGATVTGVHMNEWIVDDLISQDAAENARAGSFTEIEKANRWIVALQPLLQNPNTDPMTFIGTPWWLQDCYHFIEETFSKGEEEQEFWWPCELPSGAVHRVRLIKRGQLAIFRMPARDESTGRPVFPERFDNETLDDLRRTDPVFFAAQYLLRPGAGEAANFREEWLKEYEWEMDGKQLRYRDAEGNLHYKRVRDLIVITSADSAISDKKGSARSSVLSVGTDGHHLFLLNAWAGRVGSTEHGNRILDDFMRFHSAYIVIEAVAYQEALGDVMTLLAKERKIAGRLPIYEHRTGGQTRKEARIDGLEPYFNRGFFYVHRPSQQDFLDEYRSYPHTKLRDMLDGLSFQKELWERLATRREASDPAAQRNPIAEAARLQRQRVANRVRDRYTRRRYGR